MSWYSSPVLFWSRSISSYRKIFRDNHAFAFKDVNQKILKIVHNNKIDFDTAVKKQVFCPLGSGVIDFDKTIKLLKKINYDGYATIEQDIDPNEGLNPIEYAKKSLAYLNNLKQV